MPLHSDGPISIANVRGEMGGATPDGMSEYYAGGGRTPAGCEGDGGPVPTSGSIRLSDFYGACATVVDPTPTTNLKCWGPGPVQSGIWVYPANTMGYSYYCLETDPGVFSPGFGNYSGNRFLENGSINEGFYSIIFMMEQNVSIHNTGFNILMYNDAFGSFYKYRFDIVAYQNNNGSPGTFFRDWTLYSASATADADIVARYGTSCGSTRTVRQLFFDTGMVGPGISQTDLYIDCTITRTSP